MPENINTADQQKAGAGESGTADTTKNNDTANKAGTDNSGAGEGRGNAAGAGNDTGQDKAKAPAGKEADKQGDEGFVDDGKEPEIRPVLTAKDHIIRRQQKKILELKGKQAGEEDKDNEGEEGDDTEVASEDEALIQKVVAKQFAPVIERTQHAEDEREISVFLTANPDFKPYEAKVRRYIQHPSRRGLPIKSVFYEVAGDDLLKLGAKRKEKADQEAKNTQTGGGTSRGTENGKGVWELSDDEFAREQERVRRGSA